MDDLGVVPWLWKPPFGWGTFAINQPVLPFTVFSRKPACSIDGANQRLQLTIEFPCHLRSKEKHAQFPYVRSMEKHTLGICHDTVKMMAVFPGKFKWDMGVWRNTHQVQWWFNGIVMGYNYDQQCEMGVAKRNYHSHQYRVTSEPRCVTPNDAQAIPANLW